MFYNKKMRVLFIIFSLFMLGGCVSKPNAESSVAIINDATEPCTKKNDNIEDTVLNNELWKEATSLIVKRKYPQAISILSRIEDDDRAYELLQQLRYVISGDYIENLDVGVAAIDTEGKVIIRINNEVYEANGYARIRNWADIERLSYVFGGLDAMNNEGVFFTTLEDENLKQRNEQLAMISGINIFETSESTYAVTDQSGKLYFYNKYNDYLENESVQKEIEGWSDIVDIVTGNNRLAVLHKDGTVSFVYSNKLPGQNIVTNKYSDIYNDMHEWTDIVDISGDDTGSIAALKANGTVLISNRVVGQGIGENYSEVSKWTDIIAISKTSQNILGLKSDGTVVTAGNVNEGQKGIAEWTDIVAISAGQNFHVGLKADGTLVVAGENEGNWLLPDVSNVRNLYVPKINLNE